MKKDHSCLIPPKNYLPSGKRLVASVQKTGVLRGSRAISWSEGFLKEESLGLSPVISAEGIKSPQSFRLRKGYTLIELLIVTSVLSIVMLAIYSSFISGMTLWKRSKSLGISEARVILGLEKLSSQLRRSINFSPVGFSGSAGKISFLLVEGTEIMKTSFEFDPSDKLIWVSKEKYTYAPQAQEPEKRALISGVVMSGFSYYYFDNATQKYLWKDEWKQEDGIPIAVRIVIEYKDAAKTQTVFLPIAANFIYGG